MGARAGRAFVLRPTRPRYIRGPVSASPDATITATVVAGISAVPLPGVTATVLPAAVAAVAAVPGGGVVAGVFPATIVAVAGITSLSPDALPEPATVEALADIPQIAIYITPNTVEYGMLMDALTPDVRRMELPRPDAKLLCE